MPTYSSTVIQQVNAPVSYPDILGLYFGLTRFIGEENISFLNRLYKSSNALKDTSVQGLIDTISLNLNLGINPAINIQGPANFTAFTIPGLLFINTTQIKLFNLADDSYIEWKTLSQIVSEINNISGFSATLLISDRSALTLSKQSNTKLVLNEVVNALGLMYTVKNTELLSNSIIFNLTAPNYTVQGNTITFATNPNPGLEISYQVLKTPFTLISSDVSFIALEEPNFIKSATTPSGALAYQIQEAIQEIMSTDRSYWTK